MEYVKYDPKQRAELRKNLERLRLGYNLSKQELADDLGYSRNTIDSWIREDRVEELIKLDEPQKPVVPQFVVDWIEFCKEHLINSLYLAMTPSFLKANNQGIELTIWIEKNEETFARAWIFGYTVEKEKRYLVKMKGVAECGNYLNKALSSGEYFFSSKNEVDGYRTKHTRQKLAEAGFGEVFNSPLFEVEEVE